MLYKELYKDWTLAIITEVQVKGTDDRSTDFTQLEANGKPSGGYIPTQARESGGQMDEHFG